MDFNIFDLEEMHQPILDKNKKIRFGSFFSGYDSQAMALERLGIDFEFVCISEIDKYALQVHKALWGEINNLGAVGSFDRLPPNLDIATWSFPCFTKDTLVLTDKGYKQIVDLVPGEKVLTHTNKYQPILKWFNQGEKQTYVINAMHLHELNTTENHKFLARKRYRQWNNSIRADERHFEQPQWIETKDLTNDYYLGYAINKTEIIPSYKGYKKTYIDGRVYTFDRLVKYMNNKDFWYLIGRYIGDGWFRTQGGIVIGDGYGQTDDIEEVLKRLGIHYNVIKERTVIKIHIPMVELSEFLKQFGRGAHGKYLNETILDLPIGLLQSFLDGYIASDGTFNGTWYKISTVSKELAYGIGQCIAKVYKRPFSLYMTPKRNKPHTIEGRLVSSSDTYTVTFKKTTDKQDKAFHEDGYIWFPINSIYLSDIETVYDIEVENDHSFTANGTIAHNCTDISLAGKQKGMVDGTRSNYGYVFLDTVKATPHQERPKVLIMENVKALTSERFTDDLAEIKQRLKDMGYDNHIAVLNAKDFEVAQNRERVFIVSILDGGYYEFPKPKPLKKKLKDYLEKEVDEKYYLTQKQLDQIMNWNSYQNPLENVLGSESVNPTITTRVAETDAGGISASMITVSNELETSRNLREPKIAYAPGSRDFKGFQDIAPTLQARDYKDPKVVMIPEATKQGYALAQDGDGVYIDRPHQKRGVVQKEMIQTIKTQGNDLGVIDGMRIRKLTPRETLRLMNVDEDKIDIMLNTVSNSRGYKLAGNSIVVNVLVEIFRKLF